MFHNGKNLLVQQEGIDLETLYNHMLNTLQLLKYTWQNVT